MAQVIGLVARQALGPTSAAASSAPPTAAATSAPACELGNDYDGRIGIRVSAIFVILLGSLLGATFPIFASRHRSAHVPEWAFFITKYFGSGVIIATAFIHLLAPANETLTADCLTGPITAYPWVEGIALMTIFSLFFVELMAMRYHHFGHSHSHTHAHDHDHEEIPSAHIDLSNPLEKPPTHSQPDLHSPSNTHAPGSDHLSHTRDHVDVDAAQSQDLPAEDFAAQMTALFILEFGVIFHSVFVGLTLAVAGSEFNTLYVVLVFHQTFEGLGLGSRLATAPWPKTRRKTPYFFAVAYGISTPLAIAIGLGLRETYTPGSSTALIVNGVFDSVSAGILIYTGLVELMAHEFMFSSYMRRAGVRTVLAAFGMMCAGAGLMSVLGKWA